MRPALHAFRLLAPSPVLLLLVCFCCFCAPVAAGPPEEARTAPFSDLTIYHIMVDMFANGSPANDGEITGWKHPNYAGGDLQGILAHTQYLQDLGVDAVWLSPIFAARSSHGY